MARYWSDGYKETDTVGQAAPYEVTVADAVRWDAKQDPLFYDKRATVGSENLLTSGTIAIEFQEMRQYVQEEGGKAIYIEILIDSVTKEYGYKSDNFEKVAAAFKKGKTVILHVLDTNEYAYLQTATKDYFKFILFGKNDVSAFQIFYLYSNGLIANSFINIPVLYEWALQRQKPTYTYSDVGADKDGAARDTVNAHNVSAQAHSDLRAWVQQLQDRINTVANSDDISLDQLAELVAYIKDNRELIAQVTTDKVGVSDIIDNLVTSDAARPLSAKQGVALDARISKEVQTLRELISAITSGGGEAPVVSIIQADWNATNASDGAIKNKPPIVSTNCTVLSKDASAIGKDNMAGLKGYYISSINFVEKKIALTTEQVLIPNYLTYDGNGNVVDNEGNVYTYYDSSEHGLKPSGYYVNWRIVQSAPPYGDPALVYDLSWDEDMANYKALEFELEYEIGDRFNIVVPNDHYILCGTITRIDKTLYISYVEDYIGFDKLMSIPELQERFELEDINEICKPDDYTFSVPSKPEIGMVNISGANFVEGAYNIVAGSFAHAEGAETLAAGNFSHSEGQRTVAGYSAHAEGHYTEATGKNAHSEGNKTKAIGNQSHAEGSESQATGNASHAEGYITKAIGVQSHAEGHNTQSIGNQSHAEGSGTMASAHQAHAEGRDTCAKGMDSHAEGYLSIAAGAQSHAEGYMTSASVYAHSEGYVANANGEAAHAEGWETQALNKGAHAEGFSTIAQGYSSHAEGWSNQATGYAAHAEGQSTVSSGADAHAEGYLSKATASHSHAEGQATTASGNQAHSEGCKTTASGAQAHSQGDCTVASGYSSHAEGGYTEAKNYASHAEGYNTVASSNYQHVQGKYNIENANYAHIVGNGNATTPSNGHTLDWNGNAWYQGSITSNGADYAEFFEWLDGNLDNEDRIGLLVTLDGENIKLANSNDEILGIISGTAAVLGDNYECEWNGKYLTDEFGRVQYESVEEFYDEVIGIDEETNEPITEKKSLGFFKHPILNPDYDSTKEYINRANRPEWDTVGMIGKLYVRDDGSCEVNGYAAACENGIATTSLEKTNMRVLSRVSENIIKVLLK